MLLYTWCIYVHKRVHPVHSVRFGIHYLLDTDNGVDPFELRFDYAFLLFPFGRSTNSQKNGRTHTLHHHRLDARFGAVASIASDAPFSIHSSSKSVRDATEIQFTDEPS